jgi:hypothetical protein
MKKMILPLMIFSPAVFAGPPVKDAACAQKMQLKHPANAAGIYFDAECKTAFVLPPQVSDVKLSNLASTALAQQCVTFNAILKNQQDSAEYLDRAMNPGGKVPERTSVGSELDDLMNEDAPMSQVDLEARLKLMDQFTTLALKFQDLIGKFKDVPAANVTLSFRVPWDNLINKYAELNTGHGLEFRRMPLDAAYLTFNREISKIGSAPAVLAYDIPGVMSMGQNSLGSTSANPQHQTLLGGESYSGQVVLSLVGACPLYDKVTRSISSGASAKSLSSYLNASLSFTYGLQVNRKYSVHYNLALLVKRIHEKSSSGGFFSTKTHIKDINNSDATDWFELKNESNDSRYSHELLVSELKADVMNRAIRDIAMMSGFKPEDAPQVAARSQNGAQAGADALQKCLHVYCQAGSLALNVLDSIFGSSAAVSTYINDRNVRVDDRVEERKMIQFYGSTIFDAKSGTW